jgi:hypothetical protein
MQGTTEEPDGVSSTGPSQAMPLRKDFPLHATLIHHWKRQLICFWGSSADLDGWSSLSGRVYRLSELVLYVFFAFLLLNHIAVTN